MAGKQSVEEPTQDFLEGRAGGPVLALQSDVFSKVCGMGVRYQCEGLIWVRISIGLASALGSRCGHHGVYLEYFFVPESLSCVYGKTNSTAYSTSSSPSPALCLPQDIKVSNTAHKGLREQLLESTGLAFPFLFLIASQHGSIVYDTPGPYLQLISTLCVGEGACRGHSHF